MPSGFVEQVVATLHGVVLLIHIAQGFAAQGIGPGRLVLGNVVFAVLDHLAAIDHEYF